MKRFACLLLSLMLALLWGCTEEKDAPRLADNAVPAMQTDAPEASETEVPETEAAQSVTVYAGAVEQYMLPLEDYSLERECPPEFVMIHFTSAVLLDREDPYDLELVRQIFYDYAVSIHYIIDRDGTVYCYIPEDRVARHAGEGSFGGDEKYTDNMNLYSIGIELVGMGSEADMSVYMSAADYAALDPCLMGFTDAQYSALRLLVEDLCLRYDIPMDAEHIIGHDAYSAEKTDPGELFDWERLLN